MRIVATSPTVNAEPSGLVRNTIPASSSGVRFSLPVRMRALAPLTSPAGLASTSAAIADAMSAIAMSCAIRLAEGTSTSVRGAATPRMVIPRGARLPSPVKVAGMVVRHLQSRCGLLGADPAELGRRTYGTRGAAWRDQVVPKGPEPEPSRGPLSRHGTRRRSERARRCGLWRAMLWHVVGVDGFRCRRCGCSRVVRAVIRPRWSAVRRPHNRSAARTAQRPARHPRGTLRWRERVAPCGGGSASGRA